MHTSDPAETEPAAHTDLPSLGSPAEGLASGAADPEEPLPLPGSGNGPRQKGRIVLAGTPIGNLDDASPRLKEVLEGADVIAAEDTRVFRQLASRLGLDITARVVAHHEHNEKSSAEGLVELAATGSEVVLVTDAGMPAVSDPGYRVVELASRRHVLVTAVPGPSAVLTALALSGLPSDRFVFEGFLPRRSGERRSYLGQMSSEARTLVFFEAPHRIEDMVEDLALALGPDRRAALCRELTKRYEEVVRGTLADLAERVSREGVRGEIVVVVEGAPERTGEITDELLQSVESLVAQGYRLKEACAVVAERYRLPKREVYEAVLASRT